MIFSKRNIKILTALLTLSALGIVACVWFWRPGLWYRSENLGHRLGGGETATYPENTLEAFRESIANLEANPLYKYSECDLRETRDHQIVLFHDWDLSRVVPDTAANRTALNVAVIDDSVLLKDQTLTGLKQLELAEGCRMVSLAEFFQCAAKLKPSKPILLEIKLFHDRKTCSRVIEMAKAFRDETGLEVHFLAFIRNIKRSHPEPKAWLDEFKAADFRVYQAYRPKTAQYDLCETW